MMQHAWTITPNGNLVLENRYSDWYVSYSASTSGFPLLGLLVGDDGSGRQETALCLPGQDRNWMILNGDFRADVEAVFDQGLEAVRGVFLSHPEARSDYWTAPDARQLNP